jgi:hypothetical protein
MIGFRKQFAVAAGAAALSTISAVAMAAPPGKADWNPDPARDNAYNNSVGYGYYAGPYEAYEPGGYDAVETAPPVYYGPYWGPRYPYWRRWW